MKVPNRLLHLYEREKTQGLALFGQCVQQKKEKEIFIDSVTLPTSIKERRPTYFENRLTPPPSQTERSMADRKENKLSNEKEKARRVKHSMIHISVRTISPPSCTAWLIDIDGAPHGAVVSATPLPNCTIKFSKINGASHRAVVSVSPLPGCKCMFSEKVGSKGRELPLSSNFVRGLSALLACMFGGGGLSSRPLLPRSEGTTHACGAGPGIL
eukprot:1159871-Pelagomonas_calceolata.AAC.6